MITPVAFITWETTCQARLQCWVDQKRWLLWVLLQGLFRRGFEENICVHGIFFSQIWFHFGKQLFLLFGGGSGGWQGGGEGSNLNWFEAEPSVCLYRVTSEVTNPTFKQDTILCFMHDPTDIFTRKNFCCCLWQKKHSFSFSVWQQTAFTTNQACLQMEYNCTSTKMAAKLEHTKDKHTCTLGNTKWNSLFRK